ncbi:MAG: carboxymuconolactone decarboxylase family protein [Chloroflexi bacterium]|nr:carboxymuconolactone decarboxylase family protein [Chloroflexota bacterium]
MTRVTEIRAREQVPPEHQAAFDEVVSLYSGRIVGPFRVLLHSPELARRVCSIGAFLRRDSPLPASARELAIITAAREWDCLYEWYAHEPGAQRAGVSQEAIEAVRARDSRALLAPQEDQVVQYVNSLLRFHRVPDPLFREVLARFGVRGTLDLTATIGFYRVLACALNAFEVPPDGPIDLPISPRPTAQSPRDATTPPYHGASVRIPVVTAREGLPEEHRPIFDEIAGSRGGRVAGPFQVLLHSPELARRIAHAGSYVRFQSLLPPDVRELAIIAAARMSDCVYELAAHEPLARQAGVGEQAIAALRDGGRLSDVPPAEAQVIQFTQELLKTNRVSEATYQAALGRFGDQGLVELSATVGYYSMIACVLNAFEVQP